MVGHIFFSLAACPPIEDQPTRGKITWWSRDMWKLLVAKIVKIHKQLTMVCNIKQEISFVFLNSVYSCSVSHFMKLELVADMKGSMKSEKMRLLRMSLNGKRINVMNEVQWLMKYLNWWMRNSIVIIVHIYLHFSLRNNCSWHEEWWNP